MQHNSARSKQFSFPYSVAQQPLQYNIGYLYRHANATVTHVHYVLVNESFTTDYRGSLGCRLFKIIQI